jgi:mannose-1-phosphate guanylyltransferase
MKAMVLAAGFGKRLQPLTGYLPKVLIPVWGAPALDYVLSHLARYNLRHVGINAHYRPEQIISYFQLNPGKGMEVDIALEEEILGTGGAVFNFREFLGKEPFLVYNGDIICDFNLTAALSVHQRRKALATLVLWDYPPINTVRLDREGNILDLYSPCPHLSEPEVKRKEESFLTFTGISIINPEIFDYLPDGYSEMPEIYRKIIETEGIGKIIGIRGEGEYWADFGTITRYLDVHRDLLSRMITFQGKPCSAKYRDKGGEEITISQSADLRGFVSIGHGCIIEDGVLLEDCILWPGTRVKSGTCLRRAVLSEHFICQETYG